MEFARVASPYQKYWNSVAKLLTIEYTGAQFDTDLIILGFESEREGSELKFTIFLRISHGLPVRAIVRPGAIFSATDEKKIYDDLEAQSTTNDTVLRLIPDDYGRFFQVRITAKENSFYNRRIIELDVEAIPNADSSSLSKTLLNIMGVGNLTTKTKSPSAEYD
jgi:hypothetical protein